MSAEVVQQIVIADTFEHPMQRKLYGAMVHDPELEQSIREKGVRTPAIFSARPDGSLMRISGNRRIYHSELVGLETIPGIVRVYTSIDDEIEEMIHANRGNRDKSEEMKNREVAELNRIHKKKAKARQLSGLKVRGTDKSQADELKENLNGDLSFSPNGENDNSTTNEAIAAKTGMSEKEVERRLGIGDDALDKFKEKLVKIGASEEEIGAAQGAWLSIRQAQEEAHISLTEAYDRVVAMKKDVLSKYGKSKKAKTHTAKGKKTRSKKERGSAVFNPVFGTPVKGFRFGTLEYDGKPVLACECASGLFRFDFQELLNKTVGTDAMQQMEE